jgi:hypothetical protein
MNGRPDYYGTYFNPDGVKRDRMRMARGLAIVRSHPFWFAGVMVRRGSSMVKLERARLTAAEPPVMSSVDSLDQVPPALVEPANDLLATGQLGPRTKASLVPGENGFYLGGDNSAYGSLFVSAPFAAEKNSEYVAALPVKLEAGRVNVSVQSTARRAKLASAIVDTEEIHSPKDQPERTVNLPFVTDRAENLHLEINNEASTAADPAVRIGDLKVYSLGPAAGVWTRYPRAMIRVIQKAFLTAVMLPLELFGIILLVIKRQFKALAVLLAVPLYYTCVQSAIHTEYRYILVIHYFLFVLVAVALTWLAKATWGVISRRSFLFQKRPVGSNL